MNNIAGSTDLARVLNAAPATEADEADTPRDWVGIWVAGTVYQLSEEEITDTLAVLADGTAAARRTAKGEWVAADVETWVAAENARGVDRDWRSVRVWDANGFSETTTYPTIEAARAAFAAEVAELAQLDNLATEVG